MEGCIRRDVVYELLLDWRQVIDETKRGKQYILGVKDFECVFNCQKSFRIVIRQLVFQKKK